jgi:predicted enzyme related to lactoylglutathione lyase
MDSGDRGGLVHLELHTQDLEAARRFYAQLCGWRHEAIETTAGAYTALDLGRSVSGGIVECPIPHPLWLPYVQVQDIRAATDRARVLGARTLLAPREGPGGWRSVLATTGGGEIALWQPKR